MTTFLHRHIPRIFELTNTPNDADGAVILGNIRRTLGSDYHAMLYVDTLIDRMHSKATATLTICTIFLAIGFQFFYFMPRTTNLELITHTIYFSLLIVMTTSILVILLQIAPITWWGAEKYSEIGVLLETKYGNFLRRCRILNQQIRIIIMSFFGCLIIMILHLFP